MNNTKNKYYIPEIEEFHVGFEYEFKHPDYPNWNKYKLIEFDSEREDCISKESLKNFRVKYLSSEDIEELGWKDLLGFGIYEIESKFPKGTSGTPIPIYQLIIHNTLNKIEIRCTHPSIDFGNFLGIIKNKSELKVLMKKLNIK